MDTLAYAGSRSGIVGPRDFPCTRRRLSIKPSSLISLRDAARRDNTKLSKKISSSYLRILGNAL